MGRIYEKGWHHTEETRRKMRETIKNRSLYVERMRRLRISEAVRGNSNFKGKSHSLESKALMSVKMKERIANGFFNEDIRRKMSEAHKGKRLSDETKAKLSLALSGRRIPDDVRRKISDANKKRYARYPVTVEIKKKMSESHKGIPNNWLGRKHSEESREKMKITNKGKAKSGWKMNPEWRRNVAIGHAKRMPKGDFGPYKGIWFRSEWEVRVAKQFDEWGLNWRYESDVFVLEELNRAYVPDFKVEGRGFVEVKGKYYAHDIMKMNAFVELGNDLYVIDERNIDNPSEFFNLRWVIS